MSEWNVFGSPASTTPPTSGGPFMHPSINELWHHLDLPLQHYPSTFPPLPPGIDPYTPPGGGPDMPTASGLSPDPETPPQVGIDENTDWFAGQAVEFSDHILAGTAKWLHEAPSQRPYELSDPADKNFLKRRWIEYMAHEHPNFRLTPKQMLILAYCFAYGRAIIGGIAHRLGQLWTWAVSQYKKRRAARLEAQQADFASAQPPEPTAPTEYRPPVPPRMQPPEDAQIIENTTQAHTQNTNQNERVFVAATHQFLSEKKARGLCLLPECDVKLTGKAKAFCCNAHKAEYLKWMNRGKYPKPSIL